METIRTSGDADETDDAKTSTPGSGGSGRRHMFKGGVNEAPSKPRPTGVPAGQDPSDG